MNLSTGKTTSPRHVESAQHVTGKPESARVPMVTRDSDQPLDLSMKSRDNREGKRQSPVSESNSQRTAKRAADIDSKESSKEYSAGAFKRVKTSPTPQTVDLQTAHKQMWDYASYYGNILMVQAMLTNRAYHYYTRDMKN